MSDSTKIYAIRNKETKQFERFNNKTCWMSVAAAKSSYAASSWRRNDGFNQDEYEIVELTEFVFMYEGLCK